MKGVILAAGAATRMRPLTDDRPKCLLEVGGQPILRRLIDALAAGGIRDIVIVTGYLEKRIAAATAAWANGTRIELVPNDVWATTNNSYSLLLARKAVGDGPMLLVDGDVIFDPGILDLVLKAPHTDCFALRRAKEMGEEEMKVELDADGRLTAISKTVPSARAAGESVGFWRLGPALHPIFEALSDRVEQRGLHGEWYESAFDQAVKAGVTVHAVDVGKRYITEVDTPEDLAAADRAVREMHGA